MGAPQDKMVILMKPQKKYFLFFFILNTIATIALSQEPYDANRKLIDGGQFKDYFLPIPIYGKLTTKEIWGAANVLPRDIEHGIEDHIWSYWGGNAIKGTDNKYHIAICRWKESTGHWGWPKSEVAHAVGDNPMGPYKVTNTILEKGHNPEIIALKDGSYILHTSDANVYASNTLNGAWNFKGKLNINTRGYKGLSHLKTNLTGLERKDGSFLFFTKRGDVMISNNGILGPFNIVSAHNYSRYSGYPEDPIIWKSRHQYHVVYNHAIEKKSVHMRSLNGIDWIIEPGLAYDKTIFKYTDGTTNEWVKIERPKVIQDEYGRATYMSFGVIDVAKRKDLGNDNHNSKHVILPLAVERIIEIENHKTLQKDTEIKIRIKSEKKFNAIKDIDISTLTLGSSNIVNYGEGSKVVKHTIDKNDLIITFNKKSLNIPSTHYDLKLIGKTTSNELFHGYALLPNFEEDPAALISTPIDVNNPNKKERLYTVIENIGLHSSKACNVNIFSKQGNSRNLVNSYQIPKLSPYEQHKLYFTPKDTLSEYEVIIDTSSSWNIVDDKHFSVSYTGTWEKNNIGENIYMGEEQISYDKGAAVSFFFNGTQARSIGNISKAMGMCDVYIDNQFVEKIDCFFGTDIHNTVIYQTPIMHKGLHKLELRITGEHFNEKKEAPIAVDAFSFRE